MTALREAGLVIVVAILSTIGLFALMASFGVIEDLWALLIRSVSRRADPQPPQPAIKSERGTPWEIDLDDEAIGEVDEDRAELRGELWAL